MENQSVEERSKSLMNKTKKQLVEIILRKDDVHHKLNDTIKNMENHLKVVSDCNKNFIEANETLVSENEKLNKEVDNYKKELNQLITKHDSYKQGTINQINKFNKDYKALKAQYDKIEIDNNSYKDEIDNLTSKLVEYKNKNKVAYILTILSTVIVGIACFFIGISI